MTVLYSSHVSQRQDVISAFQAPVTSMNATSNQVVMLISLKSGAVGLNLTAASNVFLVCLPFLTSRGYR